MLKNILNIHNLKADTVVKRKHGKSEEILLIDLLYFIIYLDSSYSKDVFNIHPETYCKVVRGVFPEITQPYKSWLLNSVGMKYCPTCDNIKPHDKFYKCKRQGLRHKCKKCADLDTKKLDRSEYYKRRYREEKAKDPVAFNRKQREKCARRKAKKLQRTPAWANLEKIKNIYQLCPEGHHVDHIIPLQGKLVSGLHVPENLQYLTKEENLKKGNKYTP